MFRRALQRWGRLIDVNTQPDRVSQGEISSEKMLHQLCIKHLEAVEQTQNWFDAYAVVKLVPAK